MNRKLAFYLALILLVNIFALPVTAVSDGGNGLSINIGEYPNGKFFRTGETVKITGKAAPGRDIVLRIYDQNDVLIYVDTKYAQDNSNGEFEFAYTIEETDRKEVFSYTASVSETGVGENQAAIMKAQFDVGKETIKKPDPPDEKPTVPIWDPSKVNPVDPDEPPTEPPAYVDRLDMEGKNKGLWDTVNNVKTPAAAASAIDRITKATDKEVLLWETARNNVATAGEVMASNINAKTVKRGRDNTVKLTDSVLSAADINKIDSTMKAITDQISKNDIQLNRDLSRELVLNVEFDKKQKATIVISKGLISKLNEAKVDVLTVKDSEFKITYTTKELEEILGDKEEVSLEIDKSGINNKTKKVSINFEKDTVQTVKIAFPNMSGNTEYMAIVDENGNSVGGRYNPTTGALEAKISASGVYTVKNNEKDFEDIKDKSEEMQKSIKILAAKGIIEGTSEKEFSPDDPITRAEVAALLLRVLSQVDANADGGFDDVKKSDWFYGTAGSARKYGMIVGFEDNTFRGREVIEKDQILTIASRVLQKEMKYKVPENTAQWLSFKDAAEIPEWAKDDVALAAMANIITLSTDNTIHSREDMTRGEAALIIMRLFYKIW